MNFRIQGLPMDEFLPLFGQSTEALAHHGIRRIVSDGKHGYPDRIELREAKAGESVLLMNYLHQPALTPYQSRHAIYVLESARSTYDRVGQVPELFQTRTLSLRGFDAEHMIVEADLVEGAQLPRALDKLWENERVSYVHAHYAKYGCYAARIDRVS